MPRSKDMSKSVWNVNSTNIVMSTWHNALAMITPHFSTNSNICFFSLSYFGSIPYQKVLKHLKVLGRRTGLLWEAHPNKNPLSLPMTSWWIQVVHIRVEGKGSLNFISHGLPAPCVKWFNTTAAGKQTQHLQLLQIDHPTDFDKSL